MKLRTVTLVAAVASFAAIAGCNRAGLEPTVSTSPSETATPSTSSMPAQVAGVLDDAGITAKVKAALVAEKEVDGMSINVDTSQGNVTLSGRVPDQSQAERAAQVTRGIEGVKTVDSKLTVGAS